MKDTRRNPDGTLTVGIIEDVQPLVVTEPEPIVEAKPEYAKLDEEMPLAEQIEIAPPKPARKTTTTKRKTTSRSTSSRSKSKTKK